MRRPKVVPMKARVHAGMAMKAEDGAAIECPATAEVIMYRTQTPTGAWEPEAFFRYQGSRYRTEWRQAQILDYVPTKQDEFDVNNLHRSAPAVRQPGITWRQIKDRIAAMPDHEQDMSAVGLLPNGMALFASDIRKDETVFYGTVPFLDLSKEQPK